MREHFKGWYKPTAPQLEALWKEGLIALDANVLLAPYRVRLATQNHLFDVLEAFAPQLWCPYQAGLEYQRHRLDVIAEQEAEYAAIRKKLDSFKNDLANRRDHPVIDADLLTRRVRQAVSGIHSFITDVQRHHPQVLGDDKDEDAIRDRWDSLLEGKVGLPLEIDDAWKRESELRYEKEVPPGFEDRKKDKNARRYGDLILWCELRARVRHLRAGSEREVPVMFVTDDAKRDWWRSYGGERLGPDPRLTEELAKDGGSPFWMYSVSRFIEAGGSRMGWDPPPEGTEELGAPAQANGEDEPRSAAARVDEAEDRPGPAESEEAGEEPPTSGGA